MRNFEFSTFSWEELFCRFFPPQFPPWQHGNPQIFVQKYVYWFSLEKSHVQAIFEHAKLIRQNFHFALYAANSFSLWHRKQLLFPCIVFPLHQSPCDTLSLCRQRAKKAMFSYKYPVSRCFLCPQLASFQFPRFFTEEHEKKYKCPPKKKRAYVGKRRRTFYFFVSTIVQWVEQVRQKFSKTVD